MTLERLPAADINAELANAREVAGNLGGMAWSDGAPARRFSIVFECTGVQSCVQTSIYVSSPMF